MTGWGRSKGYVVTDTSSSPVQLKLLPAKGRPPSSPREEEKLWPN